MMRVGHQRVRGLTHRPRRADIGPSQQKLLLRVDGPEDAAHNLKRGEVVREPRVLCRERAGHVEILACAA